MKGSAITGPVAKEAAELCKLLDHTANEKIRTNSYIRAAYCIELRCCDVNDTAKRLGVSRSSRMHLAYELYSKLKNSMTKFDPFKNIQTHAPLSIAVLLCRCRAVLIV